MACVGMIQCTQEISQGLKLLITFVEMIRNLCHYFYLILTFNF